MPRRPKLKIGDVCRINKRYKAVHLYKKEVFVVSGIHGNDSSDGHTYISGFMTYNDWFVRRTVKLNLTRNALWYTGYNINDKKTVSIDRRTISTGAMKKVNGSNNNGLTHCQKCGQPTKRVPGFIAGSGYDMCDNPSCEWYKN